MKSRKDFVALEAEKHGDVRFQTQVKDLEEENESKNKALEEKVAEIHLYKKKLKSLWKNNKNLKKNLKNKTRIRRFKKLTENNSQEQVQVKDMESQIAHFKNRLLKKIKSFKN